MDMRMGFNTNLNNLQSDLVNKINSSGMPVGVIYYIMKDLFVDVQNAYEEALKNEKEDYERSLQEEALRKDAEIIKSDIVDEIKEEENKSDED